VTVAFKSLDRSPLGALIRSPLGAFNGAAEREQEIAVGVVSMVWIDESIDHYVRDPTLHAADLFTHLRRRAEWSALDVAITKGVVMHVQWPFVPSWQPIGSVPGLFTRHFVERPPSFDVNRQAFLDTLNTGLSPSGNPMTLVQHVFLTVDISGSMDFTTLGVEFQMFEGWLEQQRGRELRPGIRMASDVEITTEGRGFERWLLWMLPEP